MLLLLLIMMELLLIFMAILGWPMKYLMGNGVVWVSYYFGDKGGISTSIIVICRPAVEVDRSVSVVVLGTAQHVVKHGDILS